MLYPVPTPTAGNLEMSGVFWWVGRLKNGEELLEFSSCPGGQPCEMKNCPKGQWYPVEELCSTACCLVVGDGLSKNTEEGTPAGRMGVRSDLSAVEGTGGKLLKFELCGFFKFPCRFA